jgi:hypothetical protein
MSNKSEGEYRPLLRRHAEQLLRIAQRISDPRMRERIERLATDIAAEAGEKR